MAARPAAPSHLCKDKFEAGCCCDCVFLNRVQGTATLGTVAEATTPLSESVVDVQPLVVPLDILALHAAASAVVLVCWGGGKVGRVFTCIW